MGSLHTRIQDLREKLETAKATRAEAEGARKELLKRLEDEFGVKTLEAAKVLRDKLVKELEALDADLIERINKIEKDFPSE